MPQENHIILSKYFPTLTHHQIEKYIQLEKIFPDINSKINLISRKDVENVFVHHILHSLAIAKITAFDAGDSVIDIGTGGGFPGIPLAIMFPNVKFDLVDSIGKKIVAVESIINELQLKNVTAINSRAELLPAKYNFVVSRAVTAFPDFVKICKTLFKKVDKSKKQGIIYLKGGDFAEELKNFKNIELYKISDFFEENFFETKKIIYLQKKQENIFD
ncbi:16S rRNA (guanine(527)-N(7))-methyltransferase RsmG [Bacteroidales bacterium OttesenSCG-928-I21]|nr:16S rRNA (guanine(527)-N(7))-methyltransferase RsmG [Bacteroidales bacterium OttesenSCG-928-I21]